MEQSQPPDLRFFVLEHKRRTYVYSERAIEEMERNANAPLPKPEPLPKNATADERRQRTEMMKELTRLQEQDRERLAILLSRGVWREFWLRTPTAELDEKIQALCLVKDEEIGLRFDPTKEATARIAVMMLRWSFEVSPSLLAVKELPPQIKNILDAFIAEFMFPSLLDADFFTSSSSS
jgi:hypothetical protein